MLTKEKLLNHIANIQQKHDDIDKDIVEMQAEHADSMKIETLKKMKLYLKDEMELLKVQISKM